MKEIHIIPKGKNLEESKIAKLRERGIILMPLTPSWLSAFTAMTIAKEVDRTAADTVVVSRIQDAFAAVSARKLAKSKFCIRYEVGPNTEIPKGIPHEIKLQVDSWRFASERLMRQYPEELKGKEVAEPECYDDDILNIEGSNADSAKTALWLGPLDQNIDRLKAAVKSIGDGEEEMTLRILGTGKARYVMEAVRVGRTCKNPQRIVWLGEEYELKKEISCATHIIQSGLDPTAIELAAAKRRILIKL